MIVLAHLFVLAVNIPWPFAVTVATASPSSVLQLPHLYLMRRYPQQTKPLVKLHGFSGICRLNRDWLFSGPRATYDPRKAPSIELASCQRLQTFPILIRLSVLNPSRVEVSKAYFRCDLLFSPCRPNAPSRILVSDACSTYPVITVPAKPIGRKTPL